MVTDSLHHLEDQFLALYRQGRYADSLPVAEAALELARQHHGRNSVEYANQLNHLGAACRGVGDFSRAASLISEALRIQRLTYGEDDATYLWVLNNLGALYHQMGDVAAADRCLRQAVTSLRSSSEDVDWILPTSISNLAALCSAVGNLTEAIACYREAEMLQRHTVGERHPDYARTLANLASALISAGQTEKAREYFLQAADIYRASIGEDHPSYALVINNLGELCRLTGDYQQATSLLGESLAIVRRVLSEHHPDYARTLNNLALVQKLQGNWADAERQYREVLAIDARVLGEKHPDYSSDLKNLSAVCAAQGQDLEALDQMRQAALIDDELIRQVVGMSSEQQQLRFLMSVQGSLDAALSFLLRRGVPSTEQTLWGFDLVLRRKGIVADTLAAQREEVLSGRHPSLAGQLKDLSELRQEIVRRTLLGPSPDDVVAHHQLLGTLTARRERLEADLAGKVSELAGDHLARRADRLAVAAVLPEGSCLLEFIRFNRFDFEAIPSQGDSEWGAARYAAFVLRAGDPECVHMIDLGEAEPIDRLIADFRAGITGESGHDANRDMVKMKRSPVPHVEERLGRALRTAVIDPFVMRLHGCETLLIAPDGDLTRLPFEILPTEDGHRLIDTYRISYLGCGRDVLRFRHTSSGRPGNAVVAADPDFDLQGEDTTPPQPEAIVERRSRDLDQAALSFNRLAGTRKEGESIAERLGVQPWLQAKVLKGRLKGVKSPWILHIATHGFVLTDQSRDPEGLTWTAKSDMGRFSELHLENPLLRSGLALAGGNTWLQKRQLHPEAEDGLLTAEDVTGMDLIDTELVVLSACDTGLGEIRVGEGVFGLRRAFVLAGAKTLLMSLWKVPDEETRELMEDFYRRILAGKPRAEALRSSQLKMKAKYPDPFFWGAFICQGNPDPLPPRRRWYYRLDTKTVHGPVSDVELKELIQAGKMPRSGTISVDNKTWHPASRLKGVKWPS